MDIGIDFWLIVLAVAVVGGALGLLAAKRCEKSEASEAEVAPTSTGHRWLFYVLIGVLCIVLIIMGSHLASLKDEIEALRNQLSVESARLNTQISSIYSNVDERLEKQASLVTSVDYKSSGYDERTGRVAVELRVTPKSIGDGTALSVSLNGETVALTREGDTFAGILPVDMFCYDDYPLLSVTSDGETQTELLDSVYVHHLWTEYLPGISGDFAGVRTIESSKNGTLIVSATLVLDWQTATENDEAYFVKVEVVTKINGNEVERRDMTAEMLSDLKGHITNGSLEVPVNATYHYEGDLEEATVYLIAEDSLGYVHELSLWHILPSGLTAETTYGMEIIRDAEGNVLYGKEF